MKLAALDLPTVLGAQNVVKVLEGLIGHLHGCQEITILFRDELVVHAPILVDLDG